MTGYYFLILLRPQNDQIYINVIPMRMNVLRKKKGPVWVVSAAQKSSKGDKNLEITLKNMVVWNWQHLFTVKGGVDRFQNTENRASQACQDTLITDKSCMSATWAHEIRGILYMFINHWMQSYCMILSVRTHRMNKVLWEEKGNHTRDVQSL